MADYLVRFKIQRTDGVGSATYSNVVSVDYSSSFAQQGVFTIGTTECTKDKTYKIELQVNPILPSLITVRNIITPQLGTSLKDTIWTSRESEELRGRDAIGGSYNSIDDRIFYMFSSVTSMICYVDTKASAL